MNELAERLGIAVSTVSREVQRGEQFAKREKLWFAAVSNVKK
jgi:IS30 family transposase